MNHIVNAVSRKVYKFRCDQVLKNIVNVRAFETDLSNDVIVLSLIGKKVVHSYLLAIKSFLFWFHDVDVHILNDGTLDDSDKELIKSHISNVIFHEYDELDMRTLPRKNCWERLVLLLTLAKEKYVIQLDSDIIINGPLVELKQAIKDESSFILGDPKWSSPVPVNYISHIASQWDTTHVQVQSEQALSNLPMFSNSSFHYIRGCAGFTGLPKGEGYLDELEKFSNQMKSTLGVEVWNKWGSEQVASNVIASMANGAHVLPWPKYQTHMFPDTSEPLDNSSVVHFMGTCRYRRNAYKNLAHKVIKQLGLD
ncbi:hypothetical protein L4D09_11810 [Photobacterium makurazakiensis]|uniref:hypothetical protein n=1 Tax=Photobacterium makurazakiensis TaxID=2910234 RepID=UPI003D150060